MKMTYKENIKSILQCCFTGFKEEIIDSACDRILEQEPKTGHWVDNNNGTISCSYCHTWFNKNDRYSYMYYCPNCGVRMVEPRESEGDK